MRPPPSRAVLALAVLLGGGHPARATVAGDTPDAGLAIIDMPAASHAFVEGAVTAFAQGPGNALLVGSHRLAVFNGVEFRRIDVPNATRIYALAADADGRRIWVGAGGALGYVARNAAGEWTFVSLQSQLAAAGVDPDDEVRYVFPAADSVTFVGRTRIFRWDGGRFTVWNLPAAMRLYGIAAGERPLIYQPGAGVVRIQADGPRLWLPESTMPAPPPMTALVHLRDGTEIAVFNEGVFRRVGEHWLRLNEVSDQLKGKRAIRCVCLPDDTLAIGTSYGGLIFSDASGSVRAVINSQRGLADDTISGLWLDSAGQVWLGLAKGFARIAGARHASLFDQRTRLGTRDVRKVLLYDGRPNVVTIQSVYSLAPAAAAEPAHFSRLETYWTLLRDGAVLDGDLWLADSGGLWRVPRGHGAAEQLNQSDVHLLIAPRSIPHVLLSFENSAAEAWFAGAPTSTHLDLNLPLDSTPVSVVEDGHGDIWLSSAAGRVREFAWDSTARTLRTIADLTPGHGLPAGVTRPVLTTLNGLVVAFADTDILALDPAGRTFSPAPGLEDFTGIAAATTGAEGYWIAQPKKLRDAGSRALLRVAAPATADASFTFTPLLAPGLDQAGDVSSVSVTTSDGVEAVWIGGETSVLRLETALLRSANPPPTLTLQRVQTDTEGPAALVPGGPAFKAGVGGVEFSFAPGAVAAADGPFFYETRLEGVERDWSPPQAAGRREFAGLAPGRYTFAARAVDRFGRAGAPVEYAFAIAAPWYRGAPALVIWALAALALAWSGLRWRLRQLRRQNDRLNRLVSERTRELSLSNTAKSEFLENISHEIRNPLNGVVGLVALLEKSGLSGLQHEHAVALKECSENLTRVFNEVLNFSKLEYGYVRAEPRAFSLERLLASVRALFLAEAAQHGNTLTIRLPPDFADGFWGDDAKIQTIVGNFVGNALKYAPGSPVEIVVSCTSRSDGELDLLIEVSDQGQGVPVDEQELIFRKFVRGSHAKSSAVAGSGIGLATCRMMARLLDGSVGIESRPGHGATFFLKVPVQRHALTPAPQVPAPAATAAEKWALVVDDQSYNRTVLAAMLGELGYRTEGVADAAAAQRAIATRDFHVVFLDIELGETKGPEIARWLRQQNREPRPLIVGASANDSREAERRCLAAGMDTFLVKPLTLESVRQALGLAMSRPITSEHRGATIDVSALELYGKNVPGGTGEAIQTYLAVLQGEILAVRIALERRSGNDLWQAAHRVRSHSTLLGATALSAAAAALETAARRDDLSDAESLLHQIEAAAHSVEAQLAESPAR
jgi:signal transduction histidine kinase/ActR/RegA family two-component response regulator/HPt (histidine-containing phosphotransfer) domain-containing protein/ligand-binding sensor domain-containing protein